MLDIYTASAQQWVCLDQTIPHFPQSPQQPNEVDAQLVCSPDGVSPGLIASAHAGAVHQQAHQGLPFTPSANG